MTVRRVERGAPGRRQTIVSLRRKRGAMATVSPSRVLLATVSWKHYAALLDALVDENPGLRVAFDDHTLEIMSPSFEHERVVRLIEYLITRAFDLSGREALSAGSTTYRRDDVQKGAEPTCASSSISRI